MAVAGKQPAPPFVVIFGEEDHQRHTALHRTLDALLPPEVDRALAFSEYDATQDEEHGGPTLARVFEDLTTLPFLAERRVVLIRSADSFITSHRAKLEHYAEKPAATGNLILECRSFPKTTKLYKAVAAADGELIECKKLTGRALSDFLHDEARARGKRLDRAAAARLLELTGPDAGLLASEVEKLALYTADRSEITPADVADLVGQSREEKIFAVLDDAAAGELKPALRGWHHVLRTDPAAVYRAVGGMAYVIRRWLNAHQLAADGLPTRTIASKSMMWGREQQLEAILRRLPPPRLRRLLAALSDLDAQAKQGARSIENGVESLLVWLAAPAR
jgi:DNA polymerase-3 subunit delta